METNKNVKSENTLMRKTKKELVEIILRKDDVEIRLKEEVNNLTKDNDEFKSVNSCLTEGNNALQAALDDKSKVLNQFARKITKIKRTLYSVIIAAIICIAIAIIL